MSKLTENIKNHPIVWLLGFLAAVLIPIATYFAIPVPRPAWKTELDGVETKSRKADLRLEQQQTETKIQLLEDQSERTTLQKFENLRTQDQLQRSNEPIPGFYLTEQAALESKLDKLKADLEQSRARRVELSSEQ